jgi:hypothetical protein
VNASPTAHPESEEDIDRIIKLLEKIKAKEKSKLTEKSDDSEASHSVASDQYRRMIEDFQAKLEDSTNEFREQLGIEYLVKSSELLLLCMRDVVNPDISDAIEDIRDRIDGLIIHLERLGDLYLQRIGLVKIISVITTPSGAFSKLLKLNGNIPLSKTDFLNTCIDPLGPLFKTEADSVTEVMNKVKSALSKSFRSAVTEQVVYKVLTILSPMLGEYSEPCRKQEKQCLQQLGSTVESIKHFISDIQERFRSPDTSENVRKHLKIHINTINSILDRLVKNTKQLKDSASQTNSCVERIFQEMQDFLKIKPDNSTMD